MFYNNKIYREDLKYVITNNELSQLKHCNVLVTGASGLIGSFLVDALMICNELENYEINVFALGRDKKVLEHRFKTHCNNKYFHIIQHDVNFPLNYDFNFDYIIHAASNAYPQVFLTDPVGTIMGNVLGVYNLLEYSRQKEIKRFLFISSGEVYGQVIQDNVEFDETYSGYIDSTNVRACYPNAKRAAETLCISYSEQYNVDTVIARLCHIYGPTFTSKDNRVSSQFIRNAIRGEEIVMKSQGLQVRSYCYVADCVSGILTILLRGKIGNAYNIANKNSNVSIRQMAEMIANLTGVEIIIESPNEIEKKSYNPVLRSILKTDKLECLGWKAKFNMITGLRRTIDILKQINRT